VQKINTEKDTRFCKLRDIKQIAKQELRTTLCGAPAQQFSKKTGKFERNLTIYSKK